MMSADVELISDLNSYPRGVSTSGEDTVSANGLFYFVSTQDNSSRELWRSDGTEAGTFRILSSNVFLGDLRTHNNQVYFRHKDAAQRLGIWTTDGTVVGTRVAVQFDSSVLVSSFLSSTGNKLVFSLAEPNASGNTVTSLWETQGTQESTVKLSTSPAPGVGELYVSADSIVIYFGYWDSVLQRETIWQTDGTASGTVKIFTAVNATRFFQQGLETLRDGDRLIFRFGSGNGGADELWAAAGDGSAAAPVATFLNSPAPSRSRMTMVGSTLYFTAKDATHGWEIWSWDGSTSPQVAWETSPGVSSFEPRSLSLVGDDLYFMIGSNLSRLRNGTVSNVVIPNWDTRTLDSIFVENGRLFVWFREDLPSPRHYSLWMVDGSSMQSVPGRFLRGSNISTYPSTDSARISPDQFIMLAQGESVGIEPFVVNTSTSTTSVIRDTRPGTLDGEHVALTADDGKLALVSVIFADLTYRRSVVEVDHVGGIDISNDAISFGAGASGGELFFLTATNGYVVHSWNGTTRQVIGTLPDGSYPAWPAYRIAGGVVVLEHPVYNPQADWRIFFGQNGTFAAGFGAFKYASQFVVMDGVLYFAAATTDDGQEIWRSDGTEDGTFRITDLSSPTSNVTIHTIRAEGGELSFGYRDAASIERTGFSNGTIAGTQLLHNILSSPASAKLIGPVNGVLIFQETDGNGGLWATDGTAAGTVQLADQFTVTTAIPAGGTMWLVASGSEFGSRTALWKSDGTSVGTVAISQLPFANSVSEIQNFTSIDNRLFFTRIIPSSKVHEIWRADGTPEGTVRLRHDMEDSLTLVTPAQLTKYGQGIAFAASTPLTGIEPFRIDTTRVVERPRVRRIVSAGAARSIVWDAVSDAVQYEVRIENLSSPDLPPEIVRVTSLERAMDNLQDGSIYRISLRSHGILGPPSDWSEPFDYVNGTRPVVHSLPSVMDAPPTRIHWAGSPDAVSYEVWLTNRDNQTRLLYRGGYTGTSLDLPFMLDPAKYAVWVRGLRDDGSFTDWSSLTEFIVRAPSIRLTSGSGDSLTGWVSASWNAVPGATGYVLQVVSPDNGSTIYQSSTLTATIHHVRTRLTAGRYHIIVTGMRNGRVFTASGESNLVWVKTPPDNIRRTASGFAWDVAQTASDYTLELSRNGVVLTTETTTLTTFDPSPPLEPGQYSFLVRSNYQDQSSNWSRPVEFELFQPMISITSPSVPTMDATPDVSWQSGGAGATYELLVTNATGTRTIYNRSGLTATTHEVNPGLSAGTYRFVVRSLFAGGSRSQWSAPQLRTILPAPVITNVGGRPTWAAIDGTTHVELWINFLGPPAQAKVYHYPEFTGTSFSFPPSARSGTYQVWLRVMRNEDGETYRSPWSQSMNFTI